LQTDKVCFEAARPLLVLES